MFYSVFALEEKSANLGGYSMLCNNIRDSFSKNNYAFCDISKKIYILVCRYNDPLDFNFDNIIKNTGFKLCSLPCDIVLSDTKLSIAFNNPLLFLCCSNIKDYISEFPSYFNRLKEADHELYNMLINT